MKLIKYILLSALLLLGTEDIFAQAQVITGKVTELVGTASEPIIGANVNVVNSQNRSVAGAVTDIDGNYYLQIPEKEDKLTLVFSYISMKTKRVK